jgi:NAD(P)-dependent dehydrogenase (short-subunit alcohol dehydrogenase family)
MIKQGHGVIVLIGSIMGWKAADPSNYTGGFEKPVAYNLSKAALRQFAASLTKQYGNHGIRAVCPSFGPVDTGKLSKEFLETIRPKIPMGTPVSIDSLKQTLLYACCCEHLAGASWLVDGGYCC